MWIITNRWMIRLEHLDDNSAYGIRRHFSSISDDDSVASDMIHIRTPDVEWAYAFDVHLNALFPCIIILRIIQPIFFFGKFNSPISSKIWYDCSIYLRTATCLSISCSIYFRHNYLLI